MHIIEILKFVCAPSDKTLLKLLINCLFIFTYGCNPLCSIEQPLHRDHLIPPFLISKILELSPFCGNSSYRRQRRYTL